MHLPHPIRLMRLLSAAGLLLLLTLLSACDRQPRLAPLAPEAVILAFGDSLTYGTGAQPHQSYPAVLAGLLDRQVVNGGVPGEISATGLERLPTLLEAHRPTLLILCHGGNDFLRRKSQEALTENLRQMIELAHARGCEVLLVGVPQPGLLLDTAELYEELADQYALPYEGESLSDILADRSLKSDPIHPNAAGYRKLAETLAELIEEAAGS